MVLFKGYDSDASDASFGFMKDVSSDKGSVCSESPIDEYTIKEGTPEADTKSFEVLTPAHATLVRSVSPVTTVKATLFEQSWVDQVYNTMPVLLLMACVFMLTLKALAEAEVLYSGVKMAAASSASATGVTTAVFRTASSGIQIPSSIVSGGTRVMTSAVTHVKSSGALVASTANIAKLIKTALVLSAAVDAHFKALVERIMSTVAEKSRNMASAVGSKLSSARMTMQGAYDRASGHMEGLSEDMRFHFEDVLAM